MLGVATNAVSSKRGFDAPYPTYLGRLEYLGVWWEVDGLRVDCRECG